MRVFRPGWALTGALVVAAPPAHAQRDCTRPARKTFRDGDSVVIAQPRTLPQLAAQCFPRTRMGYRVGETAAGLPTRRIVEVRIVQP